MTNFTRLVIAGAAAAALSGSLRADVITSDPSLPVLYPTGVYRTNDGIFATYHALTAS